MVEEDSNPWLLTTRDWSSAGPCTYAYAFHVIQYPVFPRVMSLVATKQLEKRDSAGIQLIP